MEGYRSCRFQTYEAPHTNIGIHGPFHTQICPYTDFSMKYYGVLVVKNDFAQKFVGFHFIYHHEYLPFETNQTL